MKERYCLSIKLHDIERFRSFILYDTKNRMRYHGCDFIKDTSSFMFESDEDFINSFEITKQQFEKFLNLRFGTTLTVKSFKRSYPEFFI